MKRWLAVGLSLAVVCAALAEVPPVETAEPVVQMWGEEADDEVQRDGLLFWRDDCGALYIGDGETPGGKAVCVGLPPDLYSWTNDVSANGHALLWGGGWSQQAEGDSLLVRLGTNSWLRFVAADAGTHANLAVSDLDTATRTMRLTADTADPGAVLLVATNLLDPEAWQPATNGEIVASTDASTTWLITLLDTPFEAYRVRTSVTLEFGIHALSPLYAHQGLDMNGERWDAWPDVGALAERIDALEATSAVLRFTNCASLGTTNRVEFADCSDVLVLLDGPDGHGRFSGCTLELPACRLPHPVRLTIMTRQMGNPATLHVTVEGSDWFEVEGGDDMTIELLYTPAFSSEASGRWSYLSGRNQFTLDDVEVEFLGEDGGRFLMERL